MKQHTFNKVDYNIDVGNWDGACEHPETSRPTIYIKDTGQRIEDLITIFLHEGLHACKWRATEKKVDQTAKDLAGMLCKHFYIKRKSTKT